MAAERATHEPWLVVTVLAPTPTSLAIAAEELVAIGGSAVEELDDAVRTYLQPDAAPATIVERLASGLRSAGVHNARVDWQWRPAEDWDALWRRGLAPRRVGAHIVVAPSWTTPPVRPEDVTIVIDPQMAFGTGEHASTRGVLRLLQRRLQPGAHVLDVGTGSAILAIAAALLGAAQAHGVDSDADALLNAADNLAANGVAERVTLERAHVDDAYLRRRRGQYDLVVANVLSGVLRPLLPALRATLRPGGGLILGGILTSEAAAMISAANEAGLRLETEDREDGWWSGLAAVAPR